MTKERKEVILKEVYKGMKRGFLDWDVALKSLEEIRKEETDLKTAKKLDYLTEGLMKEMIEMYEFLRVLEEIK
ncbi:MAG: hypothetical protein PWQ45_133 [Thermosipho sp. (in: thermotogales)]|jgi:hypothetical protein|nr:hypothetical protein [Thermosipho sp. (in: thermotogales)]